MSALVLLLWVPAVAWAGDRDHDRVPDHRDFCPDIAGGGDRSGDGCPAAPPASPDRDGDGLHDGVDACSSEREDVDGFRDDDGCPDVDDDMDGVPDAVDACRREPEDRDGVADGDGCPEADPTPSARPLGACAFPSGAAVVDVSVVNAAGAASVYRVDGACVETLVRALQPGETHVERAAVGQVLVVRRGAADPAGAAMQWVVPLVSDAPAVRVPTRPSGAPASCHGAVVGVRRAPFVPADALDDALLFRCDGRAELLVLEVNGMAMLANPPRMPAEGTRGTVWVEQGHWTRFVADDGGVFAPVSTAGE